MEMMRVVVALLRFDQINRDNVHKLKEAWRFRTGDLQRWVAVMESSKTKLTLFAP